MIAILLSLLGISQKAVNCIINVRAYSQDDETKCSLGQQEGVEIVRNIK